MIAEVRHANRGYVIWQRSPNNKKRGADRHSEHPRDVAEQRQRERDPERKHRGHQDDRPFLGPRQARRLTRGTRRREDVRLCAHVC
jgi:hypothetical protein